MKGDKTIAFYILGMIISIRNLYFPQESNLWYVCIFCDLSSSENSGLYVSQLKYLFIQIPVWNDNLLSFIFQYLAFIVTSEFIARNK